MSTEDFSNAYNNSLDAAKTKTARFSKPNFNFGNKFKNVKKTHLYIGGILILLVVTFLAGRFFAPSATLGTSTDSRTTAPTPKATQAINKTYEFPLTDDTGKQVSKIKYVLQSANLQDSFIYQGKLATAVKGRTFLIFDLKITNPYTKNIQINAKDYVRVKINGSDELLAPEIHNDPVQIQADSTKYTRIGLPIKDTDKDIVIYVGGLNGKKDIIKLNLEK
jgi:hypothetical protein